jgi:hypothetical protein
LDDEERALLDALASADSGELRAGVSLALAKFYEHRRKDLARALEHATQTSLAEGDDGRARRVSRLERRLSRQR